MQLQRFSEINSAKRVTVLGQVMTIEPCNGSWRSGTVLNSSYVQFGLHESKYQALQNLRSDIVRFGNSYARVNEQLAESWMKNLVEKIVNMHDEILGLGILGDADAKGDSIILNYQDFEFAEVFDHYGIANTLDGKVVVKIDLLDIPEDDARMNSLGIDDELTDYALRVTCSVTFTNDTIQDFESTKQNSWDFTPFNLQYLGDTPAEVIKTVLNGDVTDWFSMVKEAATASLAKMVKARFEKP